MGSLSPDFEYLIRLRAITTISHTWTGVIIFDLPFTIIAALLFYAFIKEPLIAHLPAPLDARFAAGHDGAWNRAPGPMLSRFSIFLVSALIGIISHILWDGFTHADDIFVRRWPMLWQVTPILDLPLYDLLQYVSSIAGIAAVVIAIVSYRPPQTVSITPPIQPLKARAKIFYWLAVVVGALACGLLRCYFLPGLGWFELLVEFVVAMMSGAIVSLAAASLLLRNRE
jgi:hypothetical protein